MPAYLISIRLEPGGKPITFRGREAWTVKRLIEAGNRGFSSFDEPAPRLSHYIWRLRRAGIEIETVSEQHGGTFPGQHGKYFLRSRLVVVTDQTTEVAA